VRSWSHVAVAVAFVVGFGCGDAEERPGRELLAQVVTDLSSSLVVDLVQESHIETMFR
jgi:hypothetical protein